MEDSEGVQDGISTNHVMSKKATQSFPASKFHWRKPAFKRRNTENPYYCDSGKRNFIIPGSIIRRKWGVRGPIATKKDWGAVRIL